MAVIDGNPWFVAADVCRAMGGIEDNERGVKSFDTSAGPRKVIIISESGLYKLVLRAQRKNEAARKFQDWVTGVVLPAIRKDGAYINGEEKLATGEMDENELIARALLAVQKKLERTEAERVHSGSKPKSGVDATFPRMYPVTHWFTYGTALDDPASRALAALSDI